MQAGRALAQDVLQAGADQLLNSLRGRPMRWNWHHCHASPASARRSPSLIHAVFFWIRQPRTAALSAAALRGVRACAGAAARAQGGSLLRGRRPDPCSPVGAGPAGALMGPCSTAGVARGGAIVPVQHPVGGGNRQSSSANIISTTGQRKLLGLGPARLRRGPQSRAALPSRRASGGARA